MNLMQRRMSAFLNKIARSEVARLDPESPCAKELSKIDADNVIKTEIDRICGVASMAEIAALLSLGTRLSKISVREHGEMRSDIRNDIKKMGEKLVARAEKESGELRIPKTFRQLLLSL